MKKEGIFPADTRSGLYFFSVLACFLVSYGMFRLATRNVFELSRYSAVSFCVAMAIAIAGAVFAVCGIVRSCRILPGGAFLTLEAACGLLAALIWSIEAAVNLPYFAQLLHAGQLVLWQYRCLWVLLVANLTLVVAFTLASSVLLCCGNLPKALE